MKRNLPILWLLFIMLYGFSSCSDKEIAKNNESILFDGDVQLNINAIISETKMLVSRGIDPDGLGLKTLHLLCFDDFGLYIGRREASDIRLLSNSGQGENYSIKVTVPEDTRCIHFLSNVAVEEMNAVPGMSETTLIPSIVSASGLMVYWGRVQFKSETELINFAENGNVTLFRNQAQICYQIVDEAARQGLNVFGYAICNTRAWGTAAPFNTKAEDGHQFDFDLTAPYVTEPAEQYKILTNDPTQVTQKGYAAEGDPRYVFETPNSLSEPIYVIMHIGKKQEEAKYYKVMFVDERKKQIPIWRNYKYVIRIKNLPVQMGYDTYDEAKKGIAANNVWVSVDPQIPEISDGNNTLKVIGGTTQIFNKGGEQTIAFTYTGGQDEISVSWLDNDGGVSGSVPEVISKGENNYLININLEAPGEEAKLGSLLLRAGVFSRQIKIYLMKPFEFKPVFISTGVPMKKGEQVFMTFVIPDNYPEELFPLACKIAANKITANDDLGIQLSIISEECKYNIDNEEGEEPDRIINWGYKHVYMATRPGIQKLFFTLNASEGNDPTGTILYPQGQECPYIQQNTDHTHVYLEADGFKDEENIIIFQGGETNNCIAIQGANPSTPGFLSLPILPAINQPVTITLNFQGSIPVTDAVMCIATTSLEPVENEKRRYENGGNPTTNGIVNYYWIKPGNNNSITLNFRTCKANVNDMVRFSIDNNNNFKYNSDATKWFKSAAIELTASPKYLAFDFTVVSTNFKNEVKYGLNQPVNMNFTIPKEVIDITDLTLFIKTNNLKPDKSGPNAIWLKPAKGGYLLNIPKGTPVGECSTFQFLTNRIANAETVSINMVENSQVLFESEFASFTNLPISGKLKLEGVGAPFLNENSFITLERKNGTRVGDFNIDYVEPDGIAHYKLTVRPEYDFTMEEELIVLYHPLDEKQNYYQAYTIFSTLVAPDLGEEVPLIILIKE